MSENTLGEWFSARPGYVIELKPATSGLAWKASIVSREGRTVETFYGATSAVAATEKVADWCIRHLDHRDVDLGDITA